MQWLVPMLMPQQLITKLLLLLHHRAASTPEKQRSVTQRSSTPQLQQRCQQPSLAACTQPFQMLRLPCWVRRQLPAIVTAAVGAMLSQVTAMKARLMLLQCLSACMRHCRCAALRMLVRIAVLLMYNFVILESRTVPRQSLVVSENLFLHCVASSLHAGMCAGKTRKGS